MNFATLQGLTIPEGVVAEIKDASGRVLWSANKPVILQVEKIISDTYAGETTYTGEEFILLDIYPKTNGTVKVTYGGLTKTITDTSGVAEPNAQQVYFGTFHGVTDSVETPASGELTIEGSYRGFGVGSVGLSKGQAIYAGGIKAVTDWGSVNDFVPGHAFEKCSSLTSIDIPDGVTSIGDYAFNRCSSLTSINIPDGVTLINNSTFRNCSSLTSINMPDGVTSIDDYAFEKCSSLTSIDIPDGVTSIGDYAFYDCTGLTSIGLNEGLKTIGADAFHMGTQTGSEIALHRGTITFPSTLESIGANAFRYDDYSGSGDTFYFTYVGTAIMLATTPPTLGEDCFGYRGQTAKGDGDFITFIVPKGCGATYKAAEGWSHYINQITEAS